MMPLRLEKKIDIVSPFQIQERLACQFHGRLNYALASRGAIGTDPSARYSKQERLSTEMRYGLGQKLILPIVFITLLLSACASALNPMPRPDLLGEPAPVTASMRTMIITPDTKYVNVTGGETVKFVARGKSFAWTFDGQTQAYAFDLRKAAPSGVLDHKVEAYVESNPLYRGN